MKENRFQKARDFSIVELLEMFGVEKVARRGKVYYKCPLHNDDTPSFSVKNNRFKCFGCLKGGSTIDLVQELLGINEIEAVNYILNKDKIYKPIEKKEDVPQDDISKSNKLRNMLLKNCKEDRTILDNYFSSRGLQYDYRHIDSNQIQILSNEYKGIKSVVYNFPKQNFSIQRGVNEKFIRNYGSVTFTTCLYHKYWGRDREFCIVEGIEDGLSAIKLGYNFISLNSVANLGKLIEKFTKHKDKLKGYKFHIALDNDNVGIEASKKLKEWFISNDIEYTNEVFKMYYQDGLKDLNDYVLSMPF